MHYVVMRARDRERYLGLRARAGLTPSPRQQTVVAAPQSTRRGGLRRQPVDVPLGIGVVARRRSAIRWTGTPAVIVERRTRAAATPWRG